MKDISEEELREIVEVVWMTVLELPVTPGVETDLWVADCITAHIEITGAWHGLVLVRASEVFLSHAASIIFSMPVEEVTDMDRSDTLTELTNMLGGTVKCLLPEICDLSLPTLLTSEAGDDDSHTWLNFNCESFPLAVAVTEGAEGLQKAA